MREETEKKLVAIAVCIVVVVLVIGFGALICVLNPKECAASCIDYEEMRK